MRVLPFASLMLPDIAEEYMSMPMSQDQVKLSGPYGSVLDIVTLPLIGGVITSTDNISIPAITVVENHQTTFIRITSRNPLHIMLSKQHLVLGSASLVTFWIAITIQNVTSFTTITSCVTCGFFGSSAVIYDVYFIGIFTILLFDLSSHCNLYRYNVTNLFRLMRHLQSQ